MCVIVYKPKGYALPSNKQLEACFNANPHGAGYMLPLNGKVFIRKGFMSFKDFKRSLCKTITAYGVDIIDTPIVMHFRITTQGGVQQALCHPFPVCRDYASMRKLCAYADVGLAHNGIITLCSESPYERGHWDRASGRWVYGEKRTFDYNDTMTFIKDYASLIIGKDMGFGRNADKVELLERLCGSKLAIMTKKGEVTLVGDFYEVDGILYSNLHHLHSDQYGEIANRLTYEDEDVLKHWDTLA